MNFIFLVLQLLHLIGVISAATCKAEGGIFSSSYYTYCSYGCCQYDTNDPCCSSLSSLSSEAITGISLGIIAFICIIIAIIVWKYVVQKRQGSTGHVICQQQQPTFSVVNQGQPYFTPACNTVPWTGTPVQSPPLIGSAWTPQYPTQFWPNIAENVPHNLSTAPPQPWTDSPKSADNLMDNSAGISDHSTKTNPCVKRTMMNVFSKKIRKISETKLKRSPNDAAGNIAVNDKKGIHLKSGKAGGTAWDVNDEGLYTDIDESNMYKTNTSIKSKKKKKAVESGCVESDTYTTKARANANKKYGECIDSNSYNPKTVEKAYQKYGECVDRDSYVGSRSDNANKKHSECVDSDMYTTNARTKAYKKHDECVDSDMYIPYRGDNADKNHDECVDSDTYGFTARVNSNEQNGECVDSDMYNPYICYNADKKHDECVDSDTYSSNARVKANRTCVDSDIYTPRGDACSNKRNKE